MVLDTSIVNPSIITALESLRAHIMSSLFCHHIGIIDSFNPENQTVAVRIAYSSQTSAKQQEKIFVDPFQDHIECPVIFISGGKGALTMPIAKGDYCLLLFNDVDIDNWCTTGDNVTLNTGRRHAYADAIALVGLLPKFYPMDDYSADRAEFKYDQTVVSLKEKIRIKNQNKNLLTILNNFVSKLSTLSMTITGSNSGGAVVFGPAVFTTNGSDWNSTIIGFQQEFSDLLEV